MKSFFWKFLLPLLAVASVYLLFEAYTGGFNEEVIFYEWERAGEWRIPPASPAKLSEIKSIINQPFHYLSRGNQTYVFLSSDGSYVLKFFRFGHLKPKEWLDALPALAPFVRYRENKRTSQEQRLDRLFHGHWLAYTKNCDNCGLVFVHLANSHELDAKVTVVDRVGIAREIDLSKTPFVLQKKATVAREALRLLLQKGEMEEVYKHIDQIFSLYLSEYERGIFDRDCNVIDNVAFSGGKAIRIDVGKIRYDELMRNPESQSIDLEMKVVKRLKSWTKKYFPKQYSEVNAHLEQRVYVDRTLHIEG